MQCLYELLFVVAFVVVMPGTHSYKEVVTIVRIRLVLCSDTEKCRQLPSGMSSIEVLMVVAQQRRQ